MSDPVAEYDAAAIQQAYEDALDDVHTRFILNLPDEELASTNRIFFQLEQAWWFYDDFHCDHSDIPLPRFKGVRPFALKMFDFSPLLQPMKPNFEEYWAEFSAYKRTISTYGTILLNASCTKMVLCQVYKGKTWTFPAGKVNQHEAGIEAGARETYEETGFDPNCTIGLTKQMKDASPDFLPWKPLDQDDGLVYTENGKRRTCYVCRGVPEDFPFAPVARKEVSAVEWHDLDDLPKKTFAVLPFMSQLRRWISHHKRGKSASKRRPKSDTPTRSKSRAKSTTPRKKRATSQKKSRSRNNSRGKVREDDPLTETGLAAAGEEDGWDEAAMFKANERILGRKITYDGNPHHFAEKGFDGMDPHAFHVVGGSFMNSGITKLAPAPDESKLQPLFRREAPKDEDGLQPFFSQGGETPWGEVVSDAHVASDKQKKKNKEAKEQAEEDAGRALLQILQKGGGQQTSDSNADASLDVFMTDAEITARSQQEKVEESTASKQKRQASSATDRETRAALRQYVKDLPQVPATSRFGDFRFDVDAIEAAMNLVPSQVKLS